MLVVHRDFQRRALAELGRRGHRELTPALVGLLPHLHTEGSRAIDVARRAGITKQAVGKLLGELERQGYLNRSPDPDDRRAQVAEFTPRGEELLADIRTTIAHIEAAYADLLGEQRFGQLRSLLTDLRRRLPED